MSNKYIVINDGGTEIILHFPPWANHVDICREDVISAGFCDIWVEDNQMQCSCHGESISLKVKSRPKKDTKLLQRMLGITKLQKRTQGDL